MCWMKTFLWHLRQWALLGHSWNSSMFRQKDWIVIWSTYAIGIYLLILNTQDFLRLHLKWCADMCLDILRCPVIIWSRDKLRADQDFYAFHMPSFPLSKNKAPRSGEPNECLSLIQYAAGMYLSATQQLYVSSLQKCTASNFLSLFLLILRSFKYWEGKSDSTGGCEEPPIDFSKDSTLIW